MPRPATAAIAAAITTGIAAAAATPVRHIGLGLGAFALGTALALSATQPSGRPRSGLLRAASAGLCPGATDDQAPPPVYDSAPVTTPTATPTSITRRTIATARSVVENTGQAQAQARPAPLAFLTLVNESSPGFVTWVTAPCLGCIIEAQEDATFRRATVKRGDRQSAGALGRFLVVFGDNLLTDAWPRLPRPSSFQRPFRRCSCSDGTEAAGAGAAVLAPIAFPQDSCILFISTY